MQDLEPYIHWLASHFFVRGLDREDVAQEARIAVWLAPAGLERMAARRQVLDLIKVANRKAQLQGFVEEPASYIDVEGAVAARETLRELIEGATTPTEQIALGRAVRGEPIKRSESALGSALWRLRQRVLPLA